MSFPIAGRTTGYIGVVLDRNSARSERLLERLIDRGLIDNSESNGEFGLSLSFSKPSISFISLL